jgi:hypothetical protein
VHRAPNLAVGYTPKRSSGRYRASATTGRTRTEKVTTKAELIEKVCAASQGQVTKKLAAALVDAVSDNVGRKSSEAGRHYRPATSVRCPEEETRGPLRRSEAHHDSLGRFPGIARADKYYLGALSSGRLGLD